MKDKTHHIIFMVVEGFQALDLFGPLEVFAAAKEVAGCCYHWSVASFSKAPVGSESGTQIVPDFIIGDTVDVDTLILVGGAGARTLTMARAELSALSALADNAQRVVSICTGAFEKDATDQW